MVASKDDFIKRYAKKRGVTYKTAAQDLKIHLETLTDMILEGGVSFHGFGKYYMTVKKAQRGVHPITSEEWVLPERPSVSFSVGQTLKNRALENKPVDENRKE